MTQLQDPPSLDSADEVFQGPLDRARVGSLSAQALSLFEELPIQHKIRTFHVYKMSLAAAQVKGGSAIPLLPGIGIRTIFAMLGRHHV